MKRIHVAAGVILNANNQVLIALRPAHLHQGNLWEFPGGKLEGDESSQDALVRELNEELGIAVTQSESFLNISYDYPDKKVMLDVWLVNRFSGVPRGSEGQDIIWADISTLASYSFPAANRKIITALEERYL